MPRGPRLDYPGALHHFIARGIERRRIFHSDRDRERLLTRLADLVSTSGAKVYAWALMPNHAHALIRTGTLPLSRFAQRWLGPYATTFNLLHKRAGHLFQNRFRNTLVEEEAYLLRLVRYIHLNPVRSRLPVTIDSLDQCPWTGHAVLLGNTRFPAQDTDFVLERFGDKIGPARRAYRDFVRAGLITDNGCDLDGGGLRRSAGGWELVSRLRRGRERWEYDERILGSSEFVSETLGRLNGRGSSSPDLLRVAVGPEAIDAVCRRVAIYFGISREKIRSSTKHRDACDARSVFTHIAIHHYRCSYTSVAAYLRISRRSVTRALQRAQAVFVDRRCKPHEFDRG